MWALPADDGSGDVYTRCEGLELLYSSLVRDGNENIGYGEFELSTTADALAHLVANGRRAAAEVAARHPRMRAALVLDPAQQGLRAGGRALVGPHLRIRAALSSVALDGLFRGARGGRMPGGRPTIVGRHVNLILPTHAPSHLAAVDTVEASRGWSAVVHDLVCDGFAADAESRYRVLLIPGEPAGEAPGTAHAIVVYSHVVGDGTSVFRVFSEWIAAALSDPAAEGWAPLQPLALMPPLCAAFCSPAVRRWADVITAAAAPLIIESVRREISGKDNVRPIVPVEPSVTRAFPLLATGSGEALSASLLRCRAERTTINAALEVAIAAAFALEDARRRPARCCGGSDVIAMQVRGGLLRRRVLVLSAVLRCRSGFL